MSDLVDVTIPVGRDLADDLKTQEDRRKLGILVSALFATGMTRRLRLEELMKEMSAKTAAAGLTDEMIDEELAAYNAERRFRR
jgi:hypothetical protein